MIPKDIRKVVGVPPYTVPNNICWNDPMFAQALRRKYGDKFDELVAEAKELREKALDK